RPGAGGLASVQPAPAIRQGGFLAGRSIGAEGSATMLGDPRHEFLRCISAVLTAKLIRTRNIIPGGANGNVARADASSPNVRFAPEAAIAMPSARSRRRRSGRKMQ